MLRSISGIGIMSSRYAPRISKAISSSIDEKEEFNFRALAARLKGYRQHDLHAIELTPSGMPHYHVDDPISRVNADIILQQDESSNEHKASAEELSSDDREGLLGTLYLVLVLGMYYDVLRSEFKQTTMKDVQI